MTIEERSASKEEQDRRVKLAYRNVFSNPEAGIVLMDLALVCEFFKPSFRNSNPEGTAYGEGKRSVLLRIMQFAGIEDSIKNMLERNGTHGRTEPERQPE